MQLKRLFSTEGAKGTKNYLDTQKKYEVIRTILYFAISISLFLAGHFQLGLDKEKLDAPDDPQAAQVQEENPGGKTKGVNLLQIVAVLGCLPASKSAVGAIMFLRFKSLGPHAAQAIEAHSEGLYCLYDMVFTSYKKNFAVNHLAVCGNTVCGFAEDGKFEENEFYGHIGNILKMDGHKNVSVKVFTNLDKYTQRLEQMKSLEGETAGTEAVAATLRSVAL